MLAGSFAPAFPIDLVEKDFAPALATAAGSGADVPVTAAVHAVFAVAKAEGLGVLNVTGIVRRYETAAQPN